MISSVNPSLSLQAIIGIQLVLRYATLSWVVGPFRWALLTTYAVNTARDAGLMPNPGR